LVTIQHAPIPQHGHCHPTPGRRHTDSLAGRLEVITLLPFAQAELASTPGNLLDHLFDGAGMPAVRNPVVGDVLMERVLTGGYPEALRRTSASRRQAWLQDYVAHILDRSRHGVPTRHSTGILRI
jgi:predicted AAA+ superfamily ATPase